MKNHQDEKLGDVENLMVDLSAGRIVAVIVSSGGFLGMGDELSAVPPTALRCTPDRDSLAARHDQGNVEQRAAFQSQSMAGLRPTRLCERNVSCLPC